VSGQTQARRAELGVQCMGMPQKPMASFPHTQPVTVDQWVVNAMPSALALRRAAPSHRLLVSKHQVKAFQG